MVPKDCAFGAAFEPGVMRQTKSQQYSKRLRNFQRFEEALI